MGVINTTPDSFSDGGTLYRNARVDLDLVLQRARAMVAAGAAILDIGGESTRPGAAPVSVQEEMDRVLPVVELCRAELDVVLSLDTSSAELMLEGARAGAGMLNDVRALSRPGALQAAADTGLPVCLMHMQGEPASMQSRPAYDDVVTDILDYLAQRVAACEDAGIDRSQLLLDPGFGFGKSVTHNLQLLAGLPQLAAFGLPVLVGLSRKSMIGKILGREVDERLHASVALAVMAVERGARIVRVHDVGPTMDAIRMWVEMERRVEMEGQAT